MMLLVLRACLLVGSVLLVVGPGGTTGIARATSFVCAGVLGVVAALVRAAPTSSDGVATGPVRVVDPAARSDAPGGTPPAADALTDDDEVVDGQPGGRATPAGPGELLLGRTDDGVQVTLDARRGIVLIGHGALADAVFVATAAALGRCASRSDEVRVAVSDDAARLDTLPGSVRRAGTGLAPGIAVAAVIDAAGARRASVVLVPDLGVAPRQDGPTVDVTRYGCVARSDSRDRAGQRIRPVLPLLEPTAAP